MKHEFDNSDEIIADRNERAKKLYRYVTDVARRIDSAISASQSIYDLFIINTEVQRQKLRDNCEKLMFLDPINYGKKSLELLWRKVYYDTVSAAKKHQDTEGECDNYLFTHIVCGVGHLHHVLTRIQSEMKILHKELDFIPLHQDEETLNIEETTVDEEIQQIGRSLLHSCLIYLGDLSRYQAEMFHTFDSSIAVRYYLQAAQINMTSGMPYNQLGNLSLDKNHNLDAVCYYIHCLSCTEPFEGAMGNLEKIFEKNTQFSEAEYESENLSQTEHIQATVGRFLSLIEIWYMGKDDTNIPQRCSMIAHQLKISMDFDKAPLPDINKNYTEYTQALEEENVNPSYLNTSIIHNIVQICLFTMAKVNESDEKKAFACKAFALAFLSQLLQKLLQQLQSMGFKNPALKYRRHSSFHELEQKVEADADETEKPELPEEVNGNADLPDNDVELKAPATPVTDIDKKGQNGETKAIKKTLSKRRRRRRAASSESSEMSEQDTDSSDIDSDSYSDDELSESSYETDEDGKSEASDVVQIEAETISIEKQNGVVEADVPAKEDNTAKVANGDGLKKGDSHKSDEPTLPKPKNNKKELNPADIQNFLRGENFLPSIKLLQDWVLTEKDLILSCGESGESLFQCVVDLLNIFTYYFKPNINNNSGKDSCDVLEYAKYVAKNLELEYKKVPLPEDVNLRGTNICKFDKDAAEWQLLEHYKPSIYEENVVRILNFIDFGNQIAKLVPRIRFNRNLQILYLKKTPTPKLSMKTTHKKGREWHNSHKSNKDGSEGGLLRRLGQLWLTSRVRELERYGRSSAAPTLLALDAAALHRHLRRVKLLLKARSFVLLIPTVVVQELDDLKRTESTARDAIRWLETQLKEGSRFVRAQRPAQSRPLPLLKCPRKAPPYVHNYIQILEFCHHFVADEKPIQTGNGDVKSTPLLVLLTGNEPGFVEEFKEFSMTGAAQSAGITVDFIGSFYTKWRQTVHKSGKKR